jgi:pilus assembly protein CpaF
MRNRLTARQMIDNQTLAEPMLEVLSAMVKGRLNILVSGGKGAGKTTLLNVLSGYISNDERIVTIEGQDESRIDMKQEHVARLIARPPNIEGKGATPQRQLVINSLRMRPDRIVVGEVRGEEVFEVLQAASAETIGFLSTVYASSARDALSRIETMISMANPTYTSEDILRQVASAIHVIVHIARLPDGTRKVLTISEVSGMEGGAICLEDLFVFEPDAPDDGSARVRWRPSAGSLGGSAPPTGPVLVPLRGGPRTLPPGKADKIQKRA